MEKLAAEIGIARACEVLAIAKASYYRWKKQLAQPKKPRKKTITARSLSIEEKQKVLTILNSEEFMDKTPSQVYAKLLDRGEYLCSIRTMYRVLKENNQVKERRQIRAQRNYKKPELLATKPNMVWSWDITKLKGPHVWTYFYLYVVIDIYSRYVVGWMVASKEKAELGQELIKTTYARQNVKKGQIAVHSDRGPAMIAKSWETLVTDLEINKTLSRPYVSDDNPFSESQFKTLKYCPEYPERFGCVEDARSFCQAFFDWYNNEHYHSGIGLMTPSVVHYGQADQVIAKRQEVLLEAYSKHPDRFVSKIPKPKAPPAEVWINPPKRDAVEKAKNFALDGQSSSDQRKRVES